MFKLILVKIGSFHYFWSRLSKYRDRYDKMFLVNFKTHYLCLSLVVRRSRLPPYLDSGAPGHSLYIWLALADQSPKEEKQVKNDNSFYIIHKFLRKLLKIVLKIRVVLRIFTLNIIRSNNFFNFLIF